MLGETVIAPTGFDSEVEGIVIAHDEETDRIKIKTPEGDMYTGDAHQVVIL